jgi:hypothetical protein
MKTLTLILLAAGNSWGFEGAQAVRAALSGLKPLTVMSIQQQSAPSAAEKTKNSKFIRLSGTLFLQGTGVARGGWAHVTVGGWATLRDDEGKTINGQVYFTDTQSYFVTGSQVIGWAQPRAYVAIYRNGKRVGDVEVRGSIPVHGVVNRDWVQLSGYGFVDGSGYVDDEEPRKP